MNTGYFRPVGDADGGNFLYVALARMIWHRLDHRCPSPADQVRVTHIENRWFIEITAYDFFRGTLAKFEADEAWMDRLLGFELA